MVWYKLLLEARYAVCFSSLELSLFFRFVFFKPLLVHQVSLRGLGIYAGYFLLRELLDKFGGNSCPKGVRLDHCFAQYQRACADDGSFADFCEIEDGGTHSDEGAFFHLGSMNGYIVPDGDIIFDFDHRPLIEGVQDSPILNIDSVAQSNGVDVATQDGSVPNAAVVTHHHVADNRCVFS